MSNAINSPLISDNANGGYGATSTEAQPMTSSIVSLKGTVNDATSSVDLKDLQKWILIAAWTTLGLTSASILINVFQDIFLHEYYVQTGNALLWLVLVATHLDVIVLGFLNHNILHGIRGDHIMYIHRFFWLYFLLAVIILAPFFVMAIVVRFTDDYSFSSNDDALPNDPRTRAAILASSITDYMLIYISNVLTLGSSIYVGLQVAVFVDHDFQDKIEKVLALNSAVRVRNTSDIWIEMIMGLSNELGTEHSIDFTPIKRIYQHYKELEGQFIARAKQRVELLKSLNGKRSWSTEFIDVCENCELINADQLQDIQGDVVTSEMKDFYVKVVEKKQSLRSILKQKMYAIFVSATIHTSLYEALQKAYKLRSAVSSVDLSNANKLIQKLHGAIDGIGKDGLKHGTIQRAIIAVTSAVSQTNATVNVDGANQTISEAVNAAQPILAAVESVENVVGAIHVAINTVHGKEGSVSNIANALSDVVDASQVAANAVNTALPAGAAVAQALRIDGEAYIVSATTEYKDLVKAFCRLLIQGGGVDIAVDRDQSTVGDDKQINKHLLLMIQLLKDVIQDESPLVNSALRDNITKSHLNDIIKKTSSLEAIATELTPLADQYITKAAERYFRNHQNVNRPSRNWFLLKIFIDLIFSGVILVSLLIYISEFSHAGNATYLVYNSILTLINCVASTVVVRVYDVMLARTLNSWVDHYARKILIGLNGQSSVYASMEFPSPNQIFSLSQLTGLLRVTPRRPGVRDIPLMLNSVAERLNNIEEGVRKERQGYELLSAKEADESFSDAIVNAVPKWKSQLLELFLIGNENFLQDVKLLCSIGATVVSFVISLYKLS